MIHICQGHEKSIALEILLKSLLTIPVSDLKSISLHVFENTLVENLETLKIKYNIDKNFLYFNNRCIQLYILKKNNLSQTLASLDSAISKTKKGDILLTLPSSKDQFEKNKLIHSGHTEYFRALYKKDDISMVFLSEKVNMLLLTDHIPLKDVGEVLSVDYIVNKISTTLTHLKKLKDIKNIYISGINPHCGEGGLIGKEDININKSIDILRSQFLDINFFGPIPGDTMSFSNTSADTDLLVYAHHDQGLSLFKGLNGLIGINISLGMKYLRVSPDHGTAFNLYGLNTANYQGMLYLLNTVLRWKNSK